MEIEVKIGEIHDENGFANISLHRSNEKLCNLDMNFDDLSKLYNGQNNISLDLVLFSSVIYLVDKMVSRNQDTTDRWTRKLNIKIPVNNPTLWNNIHEKLISTLSFLTGDLWTFSFLEAKKQLIGSQGNENIKQYNAVSLFSGGLDSLIGAINYLEQNEDDNLLLIGHYDPHVSGPKSDQKELFNKLKSNYQERIEFMQTKVGQDQKGNDTTFRSRSLLFLSLGIFSAMNISENTPMFIPENGVISLNPPLTPSRRGSCSTRTTHPNFINSLQEVLIELGINNEIINPFYHKTKGEALEECSNQPLLKETSLLSVSCGKRGHKSNWHDRKAKSCGICIPCIYRRASMHKLGWDNENYGIDFCSENFQLDNNLETPADVRAYISFIKKNYSNRNIGRILVASGKIPENELSNYSDLIQRSIQEVKGLIKDKGSSLIKEKSGL